MLGVTSHHTMSVPDYNVWPAVQERLISRASNYDATPEELFTELPEGIKEDPEAIMQFLDTHEVSHIISDANGGASTIDNLVWEDASDNAARGLENMTAVDVETIEASNDLTAEILTAGSEGIAETSAELTAEAVLGAAAEAVVPAIAAAKVATFIADGCDSVEDKIGYGALGAGSTVLLYANPITGPVAWGLTGLYSAIKLGEAAVKIYEANTKTQVTQS